MLGVTLCVKEKGRCSEKPFPGQKHCCALTSEVPVEVVQPSYLQLELVPHGLLQGLPLGGGLGEIFIGLRHQLDLSFQLRLETEKKSLARVPDEH